MGEPLTQEQFISRMEIKHPNLDFGEAIYIAAIKKVKVMCEKHGVFYKTPHLLRSQGCSRCSAETLSEKKSMRHELFIKRASSIHPDLDFSESIYKRSAQKITVKCIKHGYFSVVAGVLLIKGCPSCGKEAGYKKRRKSHDDFLSWAKLVRPDLDYSKSVYTRNKEKITVTCKIHGDFNVVPTSLKNSGCYECGLIKRGIKRRKTHEDYISQAEIINGNVYDLSNAVYTGVKNKITIVCKAHGSFEKLPNDFLRGQGCKECSLDKRSQKRRKPYSTFLKQAREIHGEKYEYIEDTYTYAKESISVICRKHGMFKSTPDNILQGGGCRDCANDLLRLSDLNVLDRFKIKHGNKYDYSKFRYKNIRSSGIIICSTHGEFKQRVKSHLEGHGCRKCESIGFRRSAFVNKCTEKSSGKATIYLIKCSSQNEIFYKVGITRLTVKSRFRSIPYDYDIVSTVVADAGFIWDMEHEIHRNLIGFHYVPGIPFGGHVKECFSNLTIETLEFFGV